MFPFMGYELGKQVRCRDCEYIGPVTLEFDSLAEYEVAVGEHDRGEGVPEQDVDDWFTREAGQEDVEPEDAADEAEQGEDGTSASSEPADEAE